MKQVYVNVTLMNATDSSLLKMNKITIDINRINLKIRVDSKVWMMQINEEIEEQLKVEFVEKRTVQLPTGKLAEFDVVRPLMVKFANRTATCNAFVLPGNTEPLLGAIPLQGMDVLIDPPRHELIVNPRIRILRNKR